MNKVRIFSFLLLALLSVPALSQKNLPAQIDTLLAHSAVLLESTPDSSLQIAYTAAELSGQSHDQLRLARSYLAIANSYNILDEVDLSITYAQKAMDAATSISDETLKARITFALGKGFSRKGYAEQSSIHYRKSKVTADKLQDEELQFLISNEIGYSFLAGYNRNTDSSEYYYAIAMKIAEKQKDSTKLARSFINISNVNVLKSKWDNALIYLHKALDIYTKKKNLDGIAIANKGIGDVHYYKKENANAIRYYEKAYSLAHELKSNNNIAYAACDLAYMYAAEKKTHLLDKYAEEAKKAAEQTGSWPAVKYVAGWLSEAYEMTGNTKDALEFYKMYSNAKDSINNRERIDKNMRNEAQAGFEEKIEQLKIEEEKRKAIAEEKEHNQRTIRNILIAGFMISITLLFFTYRNYIQKKKANVIVSRQKEEVELQKLRIEDINKELTDSISYAKIIQRSILPEEQYILKLFPQSFGLYKPKSVVSGDFYWCASKNGYTMIAAVDCTGHGVPGALMSMLGVEKLNEALAYNLTDPSQILSHLNKGVKTSLRQKEGGSTSRDGMDIALCCFDLSKNILMYAGANRPLWLVRSGTLIEYKPTKSAIGGHTDTDQQFAGNEIRLEQGDSIYIFSDGFADQFGGDKGKKLMTKTLKDLLLSIQHVPIREQERILENKFTEWQGEYEQVDDVLVIGVRV